MRKSTSKRGQTTAEYAIIVALVAVSSIAIILIFGDQIRSLFSASATKMASDGSSEVNVTNKASDAESKTGGSMNKF